MQRRRFIQGLSAAAGISAGSYKRIAGANSRVNVALIGAGRRGTEVMAAMLGGGSAELRIICDIYDEHGARAAARLNAGAAKQSPHAEEVFNSPGIDAVLIATPDHLHVDLASQALLAAKHVYLEKPVIHRWEDRNRLSAALEKSGKVLQCGTQQRSGAHYLRAKDEIFSTNALGQVLFVRAVWSNFSWQARHLTQRPKPPGLDWQRFLGPAPQRPWDFVRYDSWRYFPDYGGGVLADIFTHWADVAQWMLNDAKPLKASALGGIYALRDGRQNPDTVNAILQYRNWNLSFESTVLPVRNDRPSVFFEGTEGNLELARDGYTFYPAKREARNVKAEGTLEQAHTANFLHAITDNKTPSAPLASGFDACRPVQMALRAYWLGSTIGAGQLDTPLAVPA